jgi:hypothetical protein
MRARTNDASFTPSTSAESISAASPATLAATWTSVFAP